MDPLLHPQFARNAIKAERPRQLDNTPTKSLMESHGIVLSRPGARESSSPERIIFSISFTFKVS